MQNGLQIQEWLALRATTYSSTAVETQQGARYTVDEASTLLSLTASANECLPCQLAQEQGVGQYAPGRVLAVAPPAAVEPAAPADAPPGEESVSEVLSLAWEGPVAAEGILTGDGRFLDVDSLRWEAESFPQNFRWTPVDQSMGHMGAVVVGHVLGYERRDGGILWGWGTYDLVSPVGREAARQVGAGLTTGVSLDLDAADFEIRVAAEVLEQMDEEMEAYFDEEPPERPPADENGRVTVVSMKYDDEVMVTTGARIRTATQVAVPAFAETGIHLVETNWSEILEQAEAQYGGGSIDEVYGALLASAAPVEPPAAWFANPNFENVTPLTITEDGRIFGHLATWGTCHIGDPAGNGRCIEPPRSQSNYAYFLTGALRTAEGTEVRVGQITMDTLHANRSLTAAGTMAHYEVTGLSVADIAIGEDRFGIWFSGGLRPKVTPEQKRELRAAPLSGDWRRPGGGRGPLELVAALAVNVPGYPIPRPAGLVAGGAMVSLVASGMVPPKTVIAPGNPGALSMDDLKYLKMLANRERNEDNRAQADAVLREIQAGNVLRSIKALAS